MKNTICVQVVCVTYNQEKFIAEALESFVQQKTNFSFEVLVGDDCSTDNTSSIIEKYAKRYPHIIKHIKREKNMGPLLNFLDLCERASAPYVAFCDGDDYWTDEYKLQKQFDFMQAHPTLRMCAHKTWVKVDEEVADYKWFSSLEDPFHLPSTLKTVNRLIDVNTYISEPPHTSSIFVRWRKIRFTAEEKRGIAGDLLVFCRQLGTGLMLIFPETMSCYRKAQGVYTSKKSKEEFYCLTRPDYYRELSCVIDYFQREHPLFSIQGIFERREREYRNLYQSIIKTHKYNLIKTDNLGSAELCKRLKTDIRKYWYHKIRGVVFRIEQEHDKVRKYVFGIPYYSKTTRAGVIKKKYFGVVYSSAPIQKNAKTCSPWKATVDLFNAHLLAMKLHEETFSSYKGCFTGKDVVILACGPSVSYFHGIQNGVHIGINRAYLKKEILLDFLFVQDYMGTEQAVADTYEGKNCVKFYGIFTPLRRPTNEKYLIRPIPFLSSQKAKAKPFVLAESPFMPTDISIEPIRDMKSTLFEAFQFALYTHPRRIFLVGNDCTNKGHFYGSASVCDDYSDRISKWKELQTYCAYAYPDIQVVSVNPIGIKGLFEDVYTQDFLNEHPEIDVMNVRILNKKGEII